MIVIKLGGSAITNKEAFFKPRIDVIRNVARELKSFIQKGNSEGIILIHGGGSFGHPLAKKYSLKSGLQGLRSMIGASETVDAMRVLNMIITRVMRNYGLPVFPMQSSAIFLKRNQDVIFFEKRVVEKVLEKGFIPILWGDVVIDEYKGVDIISGDEIILELSKHFFLEKVIFGTNVKGVYQDMRRGIIYEVVTPDQFDIVLKSVSKTTVNDVTGGMRGKLEIAFSLARRGVKVYILDITKRGTLLKALLDERVGTIIVSR